MKITLKQLQVFQQVALAGSITKAAAKLCLTKPAVSIALADLETTLGKPLFTRQQQRLKINEYGQAILDNVHAILNECEALQSQLDQETPLTGNLRLGASHTIGAYVAPFLIQAFKQQYPLSKQQLVIDNTQHICEQLSRFDLDLGLIEGQATSPDLHSEAWRQDEMLIICHPQHPLAEKSRVSIKQLNAHDWVLREPGSGTRNYFDQQLAHRLPLWHCVLQANQNEALINAVKANLGLSCLSRLCVADILKKRQVVAVNYRLVKRQYYLVYHQQKYLSSLGQAFKQCCFTWRHIQ